MNYQSLIALLFMLPLFACQPAETPESNKEATETASAPATPTFDNKAHELVYKLSQQVGNYQTLRAKKDVSYTYTYATPDGKTDVSEEQYIFADELSKGTYVQHERTLPDMEGPFVQGYDGQTFWMSHQGEIIEDEKMLQRVRFNRKTNFYWFTMFQKLLDPGLEYTYVKEETIGEQTYDVVKVGFEAPEGTPTDIYQLFINQETGLADQFLFTVVDFGVVEKPFLMKLEYEKVEDLLIPTKRRYKASDWDATVSEDPWIHVNWTDIKFNTGLEPADFRMPTAE